MYVRTLRHPELLQIYRIFLFNVQKSRRKINTAFAEPANFCVKVLSVRGRQ